MVAISTAPGQRTTTAATRRQLRMRMARLGSSTLPNRLATVTMAGPRVSAARTTTTMPNAIGIPRVWKYGRRVKCRHSMAPAMVRPEPSTTWAVPWNML